MNRIARRIANSVYVPENLEIPETLLLFPYSNPGSVPENLENLGTLLFLQFYSNSV